MPDSDRTTLLNQLFAYVRDELVGDADLTPKITPQTPLLEWGILDSMRTARLLAHLRDHLDVRVPPTHLTGHHFKDVASIADLVWSLRSQPA
ncbi:acyl carrier protein [Streptomyces sp. SAJ15]|uniref:acyl carrier protein n=1 Tax=Streptomyces sp. SAJ15 TaxID=2011095 RepID=UPI0011866DC5|nr:acyl carrier protein [Streptomyces sp. SAJ15]TVL90391.1 hypothetical protein CD790_23175 [Streptomyces sp. SAJ15]